MSVIRQIPSAVLARLRAFQVKCQDSLRQWFDQITSRSSVLQFLSVRTRGFDCKYYARSGQNNKDAKRCSVMRC